ncbi:MAG: citramalate synthase [Anaerolineae bacterium]
MRILVYDTTLRDGTQHAGVSLSVEDKLKITSRLDEFGVDYIEGGWPGSNPKDIEYFQRVRSLPLRHARVTAFGSTRKADTPVADDPQVKLLVDAETPAIAIFGKSSDLHVEHVLRTTLDENLRMIGDTVAYLKSHGREVVYDAEHFFDGYKRNPDYALKTIQSAANAGADVVVLCDTNGGCMPWEVEEIVDAAIAAVPGTPIGIHTHDDAGCGVVNTLVAVRHGAAHVQGTVNGYGERVGNANLCTILPDLAFKMGYELLTPGALTRLTELSRYIAEVSNMGLDPRLPYVGSAAFTHKGGTHVAAILRVEESYQHIDPTLVGNEKVVVISELSGQGNIRYKADEFGVEVNGKDGMREVLQRIKELENQGFSFEGAEASVDLMLRRVQPGYQPPFQLVDFHAIVEHRQGRGLLAEASVKVKVGAEIAHTVADGNGPVNALDQALRKALIPHYPHLAEMRLVDYKVRILDSHAATGAITRVLLDSASGDLTWSTVGASTNIIEASWQALADSFEYAIVATSEPAPAAV